MASEISFPMKCNVDTSKLFFSRKDTRRNDAELPLSSNALVTTFSFPRRMDKSIMVSDAEAGFKVINLMWISPVPSSTDNFFENVLLLLLLLFWFFGAVLEEGEERLPARAILLLLLL
jgi:hypothetical protein